ncbi:MAG: ATP-binding cassette domain-containing protein [Bacteroidetes bacterium]|nr:ATP-binding cassette domain-containing protein [Bacteroidota bacterium]MBM3424338.1 ABC transporter ATP-binding protein [Bacteroidota bacterium]
MIELEGVTKVFHHKVALDDVTLTILPGQVFGLIGPNGAGKTTLIRLLNQILTPTKGSIRFAGVPLNLKHVRSFGYLPEERGLYREMKVLEHLIFLGQLRGFSKSEAAHSATLWLDKFNAGLWSNHKISALSKGMAQKVQFIGSVLHNPEVLILDEPLSGFDPINVELLLEQIKTFKEEGKTVIFSTHNMNSVDELCDEAALIDKGILVAKDRVSALRSRFKSGAFRVRFRGSKMAFAHALWTWFELLSCTELSEGVYEALIKSRGDYQFNDVFSRLSEDVKLELIEEQIPGMQDVFLKLVSDEN